MDYLYPSIFPRAKGDVRDCTKETCNVSQSLYGYYPSKPVNLIFVALFAVSLLAHLFQGYRSRSWAFMIGLGFGCFLEAVGYVGRFQLANDPFSESAIGQQLVALTVAPAFLTAGIYLVLKHIVIIYGSKFSRIRPRWYTWIFITCDALSILIQTSGAGLAASPKNSSLGNTIMMVGLASQVFTLLLFGGMALDVFIRIRKHAGDFNESSRALGSSAQFKRFLLASIATYSVIVIRCIYRIAEMAGGWQGPIMQDQISFIVLDGVMCVIAAYLLNIFHPGFIFQQSKSTVKAGKCETGDIV